jgi:hypothetical protein
MQLKSALVFLIGFSLFAIMLNSSGLFSINLSTQDTSTINQTRITDLTATPAKAGGVDVIGGAASLIIGTAVSVFTSLFSIVFTIIGVEPFLLSYGIPQYMATMLESMLTLIAIIGLIMMLSGRSDKGVS